MSSQEVGGNAACAAAGPLHPSRSHPPLDELRLNMTGLGTQERHTAKVLAGEQPAGMSWGTV